MWREIDFARFMRQLIPPVLRGKVVMALCRVLAEPICYVGRLLKTYRKGVDARLNITANVQYIQKALNDAFYLTDNQIYIETYEEENLPFFHFEREGLTRNFMSGNETYYMGAEDDAESAESFIVYIPTFLCTSLDETDDEYRGRNLQKVRNLLDYYKPAGRTYRIELYDYE